MLLVVVVVGEMEGFWFFLGAFQEQITGRRIE
jgi:hypothetical protein